MNRDITVLRTVTGLKIVRQDVFPKTWRDTTIPIKNDRLTATSNLVMNLEGVILRHVRLGDLRVRVWFGVAVKLTVPILLGTAFIDCFIRVIFTPERRVVPLQSHPVENLNSFDK